MAQKEKPLKLSPRTKHLRRDYKTLLYWRGKLSTHLWRSDVMVEDDWTKEKRKLMNEYIWKIREIADEIYTKKLGEAVALDVRNEV